YRVAVDLPFLGKMTRIYLPAGAVATGDNPTFNNVYGTLTGLPAETGAVYRLTLNWVGGGLNNIPILNFAYGASISTPSFEPAQPVDVTVTKTVGSTVTTVISRRVNKGKGALVMDLRSNGSDTSFS